MPDEWWGVVRDLARRARSLGRHRARVPRRRHRREARRRGRLAPRRLPRARPPARAGHRPARQLVEPGALRQADRPAVGARDRPGRRSRTSTGHDVPPDVPLRADLGLRDGGRARLRDRAALPPAAAGALRGVHRAVLRGALLRGAPADRPGAPHRRAAAQRMGVADRDRRRASSGTSSPSGRTGPPRRGGREKPPAPRGRWRSRTESASDPPARFIPWRRRFATSSWTSTRSRVRSTSS